MISIASFQFTLNCFTKYGIISRKNTHENAPIEKTVHKKKLLTSHFMEDGKNVIAMQLPSKIA